MSDIKLQAPYGIDWSNAWAPTPKWEDLPSTDDCTHTTKTYKGARVTCKRCGATNA